MTWFSDFSARMNALRQTVFDRNSTERDLDDEIKLHIELETEKNVRAGHSAAEARRLALVAFGGIDVAKEAHRDGRGVRWFEELLGDTRFALRSLRLSPGFAVTAIVTLGLGIGATTAIFSVVNAVLLRPLPYASPGQLVMLWEENPDRDWKLQTAAPANYLDWHDGLKSLQSSAAILDFMSNATLNGEGEPVQLTRANVTGGFFSTLGVQPFMGRAFREEETWQNGVPVVILSHKLWQERFGGRSDMVGKKIDLGGRAFEVVGVLPKTFRYPGIDPDIFTPTAFPTTNRTQVSFRRAHYLRVIGRLRPGVSLESASAELRTLMHRLEVDYPATNVHMGAGMTPLKEFLVGGTSRHLYVMLSAVLVLLLIACANVGNLLLVQAGKRQREVAMRLALGASRGRLVRQAMTESVTLSVVGGIVGLAAGWAGMRVLASLQPAGLLPVNSITMHMPEAAFALVLAACTGVLFGVAPAMWNARRSPSDVLKDGGRSGSGGRGARKWGAVLVVSEVSLAVLLTLGAGLLVKSFWQLQRVNPGFDPAGVTTMTLSLPATRYDSTQKIVNFYNELVDRTRAIPGVAAAAVVSSLPATLESWSSDFSVAGRPVNAPGTQVLHRESSEDYQRVMAGKLAAGRLFSASDRVNAPNVVLINDELARQFFPNENPVGLRISFDRVPDSTSIWRTIVGVVGSERQSSPAANASPEIFAPAAQDPRLSMTLVVRSAGDVGAIAPSLRRVVRELDSQLAISSLRSMNEVRAESVGKERFITTILLAFACVGMVLAVVGVYGVIAQLARGRTREMGIRIALGAPIGAVQWLIVRYGLQLTAVGLFIGLTGAALGTRVLAALLYQVKPLDAPTFVVVPALLVLAAFVASWLPARRAARVDPSITLRSE